MPVNDADVAFPQCCAYCPYLRRVTASCTHTMRQSLLSELDSAWTCPVFSEVKTDAMRGLLDGTPA